MELPFQSHNKKTLQIAALILYVLSLGLACIPISTLGIDNSLEIWFYEDDPARLAYDRGHQIFGDWEWMSIYVLPKNGIYDGSFLNALRDVTTKLEALTSVRKVISLTNAKGNLLDQNELSYQSILGAPPWTPPQLEQFRTTLDTNLVYRKALIQTGSPKDSTILLQINNRAMDKDAYRITLVNAIHDVFSTYIHSVDYHALAGTPYLNAELNRSSRHDMYVFIPLVTLFITGIAWCVFRNIRDVGIILVTLSGVTIWSIGLMMLKYELNMVTIMMPTILVTVSVANVMHVIISFHLRQAEHPEWETERAIKTTINELWKPSLGTATTTAFGFLSLVQADIVPIALLGYFSALGIMFAYVLTFTLLPMLLVLCWEGSPQRYVPTGNALNPSSLLRISWFSLISKTSLRYPLVTLAVFIIIGGGICAGISHIEADTDYVDMFTESTSVKHHYKTTKDAGYATNSLTMLITAPQGIEDAATFRSIMALEQAIEAAPLTRSLIGPVKILTEVDRALAVDKLAWKPSFAGYDRNAFAQLILTAEISSNDDLRDALSLDHKYAQLTIFTDNLSSQEIRRFANDLSTLATKTLGSGGKAEVTGTSLLWANMDSHLLASQSNILVSVILPLAGIMFVIVRSLPLLVVGLIVNLLPVGIILGLMGWVGVKINIATILIGGITMGIAVDDTIHFLWQFRAELLRGKSFTSALANTYQHTGTAIFITALILSGGFLVMVASDFAPTADFGILTSLTILIAFATEICLMPVLLYFLNLGAAHIPALSWSSPKSTSTSMRVLLIILVLLNSTPVFALDDEAKGLAVAQEVDRRNQGYGDMMVHQTMTLIDTDGSENYREMDVKILETAAPGEGDRSLIIFSQPRDVQGTTLLTHTHVNEPDDQWLYLPALKRTKRIASTNKTGAFMSSEFTYEDMVPKDIEKYRYTYIREEACGSLTCSVVDSLPIYKDSGYHRLTVWVDTTEYRLQKIEFYDHSNKPLKTLTTRGYQQYLGKYWRPDELLMTNHQNRKTTKMQFKGYQFRNGLTERGFTQANLQRE